MPEIRLILPELHQSQLTIKNNARRFNVVDCGRRFGKTFLGIDRASGPILHGYPVGWFAPTYKILNQAWRDIKTAFRPIVSSISEQDHRIEFITGGVLECWTLENPDAGRSRRYKRAIVDEAGRARNLEEAYQESIRPTLSDFQGDADFLSTPRGKNFFYRLYLRGLDSANYPDWACWQMPTASNPYIAADEIEAARRELPQRVFEQEYLAEFIEDGCGVFRGIDACIDAGRTANEVRRPDRDYYMGVDLAKYEDFTAITVMDSTGRQVWFERFNRISWELQIERMVNVAAIFEPYILIDQTGIGDPLLENLRRGLCERNINSTADGYKLDNTSKTQLIDNYSISIERGAVRLMDIEVQTCELKAFEYELTKAGNLRMNAAPGYHDDTVISGALAEWARVQESDRPRLGVVNLSGVSENDDNPALESLDSDAGWDEF